MLTHEQALTAALQLLPRITLQGSEAPSFMAVVSCLALLQARAQAEGGNIAPQPEPKGTPCL